MLVHKVKGKPHIFKGSLYDTLYSTFKTSYIHTNHFNLMTIAFITQDTQFKRNLPFNKIYSEKPKDLGKLGVYYYLIFI